ncbi:hypothetical protein BGW38_005260 [Lunasporangiospora selenospora]|uniref:Uncharacterized protein n=1 Tax=Lunasporangiospora selenospora TaxID=979761 RepID=A0A9P6FP31_9FUNG|nr:hypothetical protein BGW38_005260 [Lunasporangiospora selenospora]
MRLLESSERGKPDYDGLEAAFMRIDTILRFVTVEVPGTSRHPASPALSGISSMSTLRNALPSPPISDQHPNQYPQQGSPNFPPHGRSPMSPALPPSPLSPGMPSPRPPMPANGEPSRAVEVMLDLEQSLDTSRTLDLFSMQPKACALSLAQVERRVVVRSNFCFSVATDTGIEERYEDGHILLLSDLLLMCRTKTQEEIDSNPEGNRSVFWLVFPPLAVRHVTAYDGTMEDQSNGEPFNGPMSPQYGPGPMSPQYGPGPVSPRPPMLAMGARPPMQGGNGMPPSPGYRPMSPGGGMGRPPPMMYPPRPGPPMHGQARPFNRAMSMRRSNTMGSLKGGPRGRIVAKGDAAAAKEVLFKSRPCDVFQWREEAWEPLVEEDDCYVELRLTTSNRLAMAVMTFESGQLVLNAWIVDSTTFRRASETDVSVSMDMGASVQWFLVAMNTAREAEEFCMSFQRTKDRAMYDPHVQKSSSPVLSRGDSLASTVTSTTAGLTPKRPVKQTLSTMYPPAECKLFLQGGDHGQWINLGSARVEVKRETPSGHVRLFLTLASGNRRVLDSVIVQEDCLELVGPKKLAITLMNPQEKMSIIYMLQFKEETITTKIFEALSLNENE